MLPLLTPIIRRCMVNCSDQQHENANRRSLVFDDVLHRCLVGAQVERLHDGLDASHIVAQQRLGVFLLGRQLRMPHGRKQREQRLGAHDAQTERARDGQALVALLAWARPEHAGLQWDHDPLPNVVLYNEQALVVLDRNGGRVTHLFAMVGDRPVSVSGRAWSGMRQ